MKKILAVIAATTVFAATSAFATDGEGVFGTSYSTPLSDGTLTYACAGIGAGVNFIVKLSANVKMSLQKNATDGSSYVLATYHTSGAKTYATSSGDSQIFMQEKGTTWPATPPTLGSVSWTGWTAVK